MRRRHMRLLESEFILRRRRRRARRGGARTNIRVHPLSWVLRNPPVFETLGVAPLFGSPALKLPCPRNPTPRSFECISLRFPILAEERLVVIRERRSITRKAGARVVERAIGVCAVPARSNSTTIDPSGAVGGGCRPLTDDNGQLILLDGGAQVAGRLDVLLEGLVQQRVCEGLILVGVHRNIMSALGHKISPVSAILEGIVEKHDDARVGSLAVRMTNNVVPRSIIVMDCVEHLGTVVPCGSDKWLGTCPNKGLEATHSFNGAITVATEELPTKRPAICSRTFSVRTMLSSDVCQVGYGIR